jgi:hypothetical protein
VIGNDYTFSFAGHRYQIERAAVQAGMRRQRLRVELRLDGELKARYQGDYVTIEECGTRNIVAEPKAHKPIRKDHNAGGKSQWMEGFLISRAHPCGGRLETRGKQPIWNAGQNRPGELRVYAQSLSSEVSPSNGSQLNNALLALRKNSRVLRHRRAFADCLGAIRVSNRPSNPELSTWPGIGTFYLAPP